RPSEFFAIDTTEHGTVPDGRRPRSRPRLTAVQRDRPRCHSADGGRNGKGEYVKNFTKSSAGKVCAACRGVSDRRIPPCVQEFVLTGPVRTVTFITAGILPSAAFGL